MAHRQAQMFGGDWTEEKLDMLRKYLRAYTTALKRQPFGLMYIDAFAGSGYRQAKQSGGAQDLQLFAFFRVGERVIACNGENIAKPNRFTGIVDQHVAG